MVARSFSLTEKLIIDPVLTLRAPLEPAQFANGKAIVWHTIQSEVMARVLAVFTSVFAAVDALIHLATGLCKKAYLPKGTDYSRFVVSAHFKQAARLGRTALLGSLAGVVWPDILKRCRYSPSAPIENVSDVSPALQNLANRVQDENTDLPIDTLTEVWENGSLEDKEGFVRIFSQDDSARFKEVRFTFANLVYRPVLSLANRNVQWLSKREVDQRIPDAWNEASIHKHSFFYHATSEKGLESILKSKRVEVRHEKAFRGAFVSTQPETGFGRCILAFRKNIERLSPLEHGFEIGQRAYWAGFSGDIPVTDSTLAYVILDKGSQSECSDLQTRCKLWTGRDIPVLSLQSAAKHILSIEGMNRGIPKEWPSEGEAKGKEILRTLKARAVNQNANANANQHRVAPQRRQLLMTASS